MCVLASVFRCVFVFSCCFVCRAVQGPLKERIDALYKASAAEEYREKLRARAAAVKEEQMAECTFQPNTWRPKAKVAVCEACYFCSSQCLHAALLVLRP